MVKALTISAIAISFLVSAATNASNIRFYKLNNKKQSDRLWVSTKKAKQTGCHNFRGSPRIHSIIQVGYQQCTIYSSKNCAEESLIKATHDDIDAFTEKLTEGHAWKTDINTELTSAKANLRGVKLRSWNCQ